MVNRIAQFLEDATKPRKRSLPVISEPDGEERDDLGALVWHGDFLCHKSQNGKLRRIGWRESVEWFARMEERSEGDGWDPEARLKYYKLLAKQLFT